MNPLLPGPFPSAAAATVQAPSILKRGSHGKLDYIQTPLLWICQCDEAVDYEMKFRRMFDSFGDECPET